MSTTAAFFAGEGEGAQFLGGHCSEGWIKETDRGVGIPPSLLQVTTEEEFRRRVEQHMKEVDEDDRMNVPSWAAAEGIEYIYCFFEGHVWVTNGGRWYNNYIPADLKPSEATPSRPVCTVGKLSIEVAVQCGQCLNRDVLDHKEFDEKHIPGEWSAADIYVYFKSKGWQTSETQGWLCSNCIQ